MSLPPEANGAAALRERDNLQKAAERKALYTDIDFNGHVNNVRYIQWIEDTLDPKLLESAVKMRFDINYLSEILGGEVTEILSAPIETETAAPAGSAFAFEGRKTETGQAAFRAELRLY
jgi:acyl-ACP thioesterase